MELFIFNDLWHVFGGVEADLRLRNMRGPGAAYVVRVGRFSRQLSLERKTGIAPFERLVAQVMGQEPYRSARRVFFVADNGSSHRGPRAADRLRTKWPNVLLVHTPIHASWLNQIEVYFSIVQRELLTPTDFADLGALIRSLMAFQNRYQQAAKPV